MPISWVTLDLPKLRMFLQKRSNYFFSSEKPPFKFPGMLQLILKTNYIDVIDSIDLIVTKEQDLLNYNVNPYGNYRNYGIL